MKRSIISCLFFYLTTLVRADIRGVIGGSTVPSSERINFIASLQIFDVHLCGGSILSDRFVLTAAHCFSSNIQTEEYDVVVGSNDRSKGSKFKVEEIIIHPENIKQMRKADLGLIKLAQPLQFSETVNKIPICKLGIPGGVNVVAYGWGRTSSESNNKPYDLQTLKMKTINTKTCKTLFKGVLYYPPTDKDLCLISEGLNSGLCVGDSGSPIVYENQLVGVTSWVFQNCKTDKPSGVVRLYPYFTEWIEKIINTK